MAEEKTKKLIEETSEKLLKEILEIINDMEFGVHKSDVIGTLFKLFEACMISKKIVNKTDKDYENLENSERDNIDNDVLRCTSILIKLKNMLDSQ
jgi:hypothetical protein